jgi:hypothetical protein
LHLKGIRRIIQHQLQIFWTHIDVKQILQPISALTVPLELSILKLMTSLA